jgi:hypothetical protein
MFPKKISEKLQLDRGKQLVVPSEQLEAWDFTEAIE